MRTAEGAILGAEAAGPEDPDTTAPGETTTPKARRTKRHPKRQINVPLFVQCLFIIGPSLGNAFLCSASSSVCFECFAGGVAVGRVPEQRERNPDREPAENLVQIMVSQVDARDTNDRK